MLYRFSSHYHDLGYRFNPFQGLTREEFLLAFPLERPHAALLGEGHQVLQAVGGSGFGKTSLMLQLWHFLERAGEHPLYHYPSHPLHFPQPVAGLNRWLILDEANRLQKRAFVQAARAWVEEGIRIIIGSHMDHESWLMPHWTRKTIYLSDGFNRRLGGIAKNRLRFAALSAPRHRFSREALQEWCRLSAGSLEMARKIGYEIFLIKDLPAVIEPTHIQKAQSFHIPPT